MAIDINSLSAKELAALINQAKKRKTTLAKRKPITAVRKRLTQLAATEGYTISELFGNGAAGPSRGRTAAPAEKGPRKPRKNAGGKIPPKYRNPDNPAETWTGRGKQPRWLAAQTGAGRKLEDFLIK